MRRTVLALVLVLAWGGVALCQQAAPPQEKAEVGGIVDNLFGEVGGGMMMPAGEDKTADIYGALNYGFPVLSDEGLGAQVGTKLTARDNDPDWLATGGFFQRGVKVGDVEGAWALLGNYERTWQQADLWALKPVMGVGLDKSNYLALTGLWGLNDRTVDTGTQQITDQTMLLWGLNCSEELTTELGGGYQFGDVDRIQAGIHAGYMLTEMMSLNGTLALNTEGDYYFALSVGFDLGANGANATLNKIMTGAKDFTPFPMGSLPVTFNSTELAPPVISGGGPF